MRRSRKLQDLWPANVSKSTVLSNIIFSLGNHESSTMNQMYGFEGEVKSKYPYNSNL